MHLAGSVLIRLTTPNRPFLQVQYKVVDKKIIVVILQIIVSQ